MASRAARRNIILIGSIVVALGLAALALVLFRGRPSVQAENLMEGARQSMASGKIDDAKVQLYQLLDKVDPDHPEALALMGRICYGQYETTGQLGYARESIRHLAHAVRLSPRDDKLLQDLARVCLAVLEQAPDREALRQLGQVAQHLQTIDPDSADALFYESRSLMMPGFPRRVEAEQLVDKALVRYARLPEPPERMLDAYRLKLSLMRSSLAQRQKDLQEEMTRRLRQPKLSDPETTQIRSFYETQLRKLTREAGGQMLEVIDDALQHFPDAISMNVARARIFEQREDGQQQADKILKDLLARLPDSGRDTSDAWLALATFYMQRGDSWTERAMEAYDKSIDADPTNPRPRHALAEVHFNAGRYDRALQQCDALVELNPTDVRARLLRADILFKQKDYRNTMVELDAVIAEPTAPRLYTVQAKLKKALVHLREDEPGKSLSVLNELVHLMHNPETTHQVPPVLMRQLAKLRIDTYLALGDVASARQIVDQSGVENTGASISVLLKTNPAKALETIKQLMPRNQGFNALSLLLLKYRAQLSLGQFEQAEASLSEARAMLEGPLSEHEQAGALRRDVMLKELDLLIASRQFDRAEAHLEKVAGKLGDNPRVKLARVQILHGRGNSQEACTLAGNLFEAHPDDSDTAFLAAAVFWAANRQARAEEILQQHARARPGDVDVLLRRAEFYLMQGRRAQDATRREALYKKALADYRSAYQLNPQLAVVPERVVALLKELGREDQIDDLLDEITRSQPEMQLQNLLLACRVHIDRGELELARRKAEQALALDPRFAQTHILLGDIAFRGGRLAEAAEHFRKAVQYNPRVQLTRLKLAETLLKLDRHAEAVKVVDTYLETDPGNLPALQLKAEALAGDNKDAEALAVHDRMIELTGGAPARLQAKAVLMSRLAARSKDASMQAEALALFDRTIAAADTDAARYDARFARAQHLLSAGRPDDAREALVQLTRDVPGQPAAYLALGRLALGTRDASARDWFDKAVEVAPNKADTYTRVGNLYTEHTPPDWVAASSYAGKALEVDPDYLPALGLKFRALLNMPTSTARTRGKLLDQAESLLGTIESTLNDTPQWFLRGQLLLARQELFARDAQRREQLVAQAVEALQKASVNQPDSTEVAVLLSKARLLSGQPERAAEGLETFLERHPDSRGARMTRVGLNLGRNRLDEAVVDLDVLRKQAPADPEVNRMLVQAHLARGDAASAASVLRDMVGTYPEQPGWKVELASLLLRRGKVDEARTLYRAVLAQTGNGHLGALEGLVRCHAQDDRPADLLETLESTYKKSGDPRVQLLVFQLLADRYHDAPSPGRYRAAVEAARRALQTHPTLQPLWGRLASFQYSAGKSDEALATCTEGIEALSSRNVAPVVLMYEKSVLLSRTGDLDGAIDLSMKLLEGRGLPNALRLQLVNNLAYWMASRGRPADLSRARQLVETVLLKVPAQDAGILDTIGYVYLKAGDAPRAVEMLEQAVRLNRKKHEASLEVKKDQPLATVVDMRPSIQYHLGLAYRAVDKPAEARRVLQSALELHQDVDAPLQLTPGELADLKQKLTP